MITFLIGLTVGWCIGRLFRNRPAGLSFYKSETTWQAIKALRPGAQPKR